MKPKIYSRPEWTLRRLQAMVLCLLMFVAATAHGQDVSLARFRLRLNDGTRINGTDGILTADSLYGKSLSGKDLSVPRHEILLLDRFAGTRGAAGTKMGIAMGTLAAALAIVEIQSDEDRGGVAENAALVVGCAIGGTLVGFVVGSMSTKWERIPLDAQVGGHPRPPLMLGLSFRL